MAALNKGKNVFAGITRLRKRVQELKGELDRIQASPLPATHCKQQMRPISTPLLSAVSPTFRRW